MLNIRIEDLGKKFQYEWIFRGINLKINSLQSYAVVGPNGSGKSTFLKVLAGAILPNLGKVDYFLDDKAVKPDLIYRQLVICAPYLELVEEFTLLEAINFHQQFKQFKEGIDVPVFLERTGLKKAKNKQIRYFSSGMKQRLKLGFAFYTDVPLVLLDEPTTNLDHQGEAWYQQEIQACLEKQLILIGSNQPNEYDFCKQTISLLDYK